MVVRSDAQCPRCGGPALHPGICVDSDGDIYPPYAALAIAWEEQGRPPLTPEQIIDLQDALNAAAHADEAL